MTKNRTTFLLEQAEIELRDGLYFEVKGDDLRIVVEALKRACPSEPLPDPVATLRLLAKCGSMDLSALDGIADEFERLDADAAGMQAELASVKQYYQALIEAQEAAQVSLHTENVRLRVENERLQDDCKSYVAAISAHEADEAQAWAEVERLQKDRNECLEAFHILFRIFPEPK